MISRRRAAREGEEDGEEDGEGSGRQQARFKPDLPESNPTAAALKFNMRRQTLSAAPSSTSPRLTRKQRSGLQGGGGWGGVHYKDTQRAPHQKTGGCVPVDIFVIFVTGQSRNLPERAQTGGFKKRKLKFQLTANTWLTFIISRDG